MENQLTKDISAEDKILKSHHYILEFLGKFEVAKRGGVHDFIEMSLCNMIKSATNNIDEYLKVGHKEVSANEILSIVVSSYQKVIDGMKRNLDEMKEINLE